MPDFRLIALDLDGTLLDSDKNLSAENEAALRYAASFGAEIVPTTGRFYDAMPEVIRALDIVRYVIVINGAAILDRRENRLIYRAEIPLDMAIEIMSYLDTLPVIYDCYTEGAAYMTAALKEKIDDFAPNIHYNRMLHDLRAPVPELKEFIKLRGHDIQKIQFFIKDLDMHARLLTELPERFPETVITSSVVNNIEINARGADKGQAITFLARHLGYGAENVIAFGDGLNDLSMIRAASVGVAMANAPDEVKVAADRITESCDDDGVAKEIYRTFGSPKERE